MSLRYLLDTNVVSEPLRPDPDPGILDQLQRHHGVTAIAAAVWHELVFGASRLPESRKRASIEDYLHDVVSPGFPILPYDEHAADWHARERARLEAQGRPPSFSNGLIAAVARVNGLTLVTSNQRHFEPFQDLPLADWRTRL